MKIIVFIFHFLLLSLWVGCATKPVSEPMGPGYEKTERPREESPQPSNWKKKKIAFVFGGAGVPSIATAGFLKKMNEAGIEPDFIVVTGWPTVFSLGYGLMNSVHDLEWFSTKLKRSDFFSDSLFNFSKGFSSEEEMRQLLHQTLQKKALGQSRIPLWLSYSSTRELQPEFEDSGLWEAPALKALSVPGLHRPYQSSNNSQWTLSRDWIDIDLAKAKGAEVIVAVASYEDYFRSFWPKEDPNTESTLKQIFVTENRNFFRSQLKRADVSVNIDIGRSPTDFKSARRAFIAGYREGAKAIEALNEVLAK